MKRIAILVLGVVLVMALVLTGWSCAKPAPTPSPAPKPAPTPAPAPAPTTPAPKPAEVIKWRLQPAMPPTQPFIVVYCKAFMDLVKEKGKGGLEIQLLAQGEILPPPADVPGCDGWES